MDINQMESVVGLDEDVCETRVHNTAECMDINQMESVVGLDEDVCETRVHNTAECMDIYQMESVVGLDEDVCETRVHNTAECMDLNQMESVVGLDEDVCETRVHNYEDECEYDDFDHGNENSSRNNFEILVGMEFQTEEDAYEYYNSHAKIVGFSVRKGPTVRSKVTNEVTSRRFLCAKEGFRSKTDKRVKGISLQPRPETREGCKAFMGIKKEKSGKWTIHAIETEHCHELVTPTKVHRLRSHRSISHATKSLIDKFYSAGVKPAKIMAVLHDASGGNEELGFIDQDCSNHIKWSRKNNNVGSDSYRLIEYFQKKQDEDPGFFWAVETELDGTMGSIFWADTRCRMDYSQFGDVVIFDTTYKTNKYLMSFAPFTGVNHHRQSILFGCALLSDETKDSFVWLFRTWLRAMSSCSPVSILTDQDKAMRKAIVDVFPNTRHRFCMWHIKKNATEQIKHIYNMYPSFKKEYDGCITGSGTPQEFEESWNLLISQYNLMENSWLQKMYKRRGHWVPCYMRDTFFAGMKTTQRSESINAFFDGFLSPSLPLNEFVKQYERALDTRRDAELAEDHNTLYTKPHLISKSLMELQASRFYTRKMFIKFQKEFIERDCLSQPTKTNKNGVEITYLMHDEGQNSRKTLVIFNEADLSIKCSYQLFEFEGIPCRHMMTIWQKKGVKEIPSQYILHRWSRLAKHVPKQVHEVTDNSQVPSALMIWTLRDATHKLNDLGATSIERCKYAIGVVEEAIERLNGIGTTTTDLEASIEATNNIEANHFDITSSHISIRDRAQAKPKGRPPSTRWKSGLEQGQKRTRTCSECGQSGHDMRTCKLNKGNCNETY